MDARDWKASAMLHALILIAISPGVIELIDRRFQRSVWRSRQEANLQGPFLPECLSSISHPRQVIGWEAQHH